MARAYRGIVDGQGADETSATFLSLGHEHYATGPKHPPISRCFRQPYGVTPDGLYTLSTAIASNTSKPTAGWKRSPPSARRSAPSTCCANLAIALTVGMCNNRTTVHRMVSASEISTQ